jgi:drug/metabolite transporter (DMT)-like permease
MDRQLIIALLAGLGAMIGWGVADFFAKKTIDITGDITTLFWGQLIGVIPLLALFSYHPTVPPLNASGFIYLGFLGVWSGLSYIPTYIAFGKGKVSLLSPLFATYAVVVTILSAVLFGEIIPVGRQAAFLIVFSGVLLINGHPKDLWSLLRGRTDEREGLRGVPEILLAICLYSLWLVALDRFVKGNYWVPYMLVIRIFSAISLYGYAKARGIKLKVARNSLWKFLFLIGFFDVAAFSFVTLGFSQSSYVSVVAMLSGAFSLPTIVLARVFLKEKATIVQTVGSLAIVAGIMLLAAV